MKVAVFQETLFINTKSLISDIFMYQKISFFYFLKKKIKSYPMGYSKTGVGADSHSSYNLPVIIIDTFISKDEVSKTHKRLYKLF